MIIKIVKKPGAFLKINKMEKGYIIRTKLLQSLPNGFRKRGDSFFLIHIFPSLVSLRNTSKFEYKYEDIELISAYSEKEVNKFSKILKQKHAQGCFKT